MPHPISFFSSTAADTVFQAPVLYAEIGLAKGNLPKLLAACNGTEYLMAAFIPIFIIEKVGRRPLMLFGV